MVEKKVRAEPAAVRRSWIEPAHPELSLVAQSQLLGLVRSSLYYRAREDTPFERALMRRLDEEYTAHPFDGSRRMTAVRRRAGYPVHRKRVLRLRVRLGLQAIAPKPATSRTGAAPRLYPYWLRGVTVTAPDPVWSTDITYLRLDRGFGYLTAILDGYSRKVLAWRLSNTVETAFCLDCWDEARAHCRPALCNTDQGAQCTSAAFTGRLAQATIRISMDGRGRARTGA